MEISELRNFDYIIIFVLMASVYFGWKNGFIESFINFFAWAGSAVIVADNYLTVFTFVNSYITNKFISGFIASFVFYVLLVIVILYFGTRLSKATSKFGGGSVDKVCGVLFGFLRGMLISIAIFWSIYVSYFTLNNKKLPEFLSGAKSYKILKLGADFLVSSMASEEYREKMLNSIMQKAKDSEKDIKNSVSSKTEEFKSDIDDFSKNKISK